MAGTMQFDLVAPERRLASVVATEVQIPGAEGDLTAMPGHAPLILTLRPGVLSVKGTEGDSEYVVTGGFAEISAEGTSVLAERALPVSEVTSDILNEFISSAVEARDNATVENLTALTQQVSDIAVMAERLGIDLKAA